MTTPLDHLADFDRYSDQAVDLLTNLLNGNRANIIALARARLIRGFDEYPEGPMFSWGTNRLMEETLEELADAVVYQARKQARLLERIQPSPTVGDSNTRRYADQVLDDALTSSPASGFSSSSFFIES